MLRHPRPEPNSPGGLRTRAAKPEEPLPPPHRASRPAKICAFRGSPPRASRPRHCQNWSRPGQPLPASPPCLFSFSIPPPSGSPRKSSDSTPNTPFRPLKIVCPGRLTDRQPDEKNFSHVSIFHIQFLLRGVPPVVGLP